MPPELSAPTLRLTVDQAALAHNWRALNRISGKANAGAAIKADCYGLGVEKCLPVLRDAGAQEFFVAHWSEVEAAARHVPRRNIAVLHGVNSSEEVAYAKACGAMPVINSLEQARRWNEASAGEENHQCHLMVDTGINRLGVSQSELGDGAIQSLHVDMLMSHLACADEDSTMNVQQLSRFDEATRQVDWHCLSLANSAGIALGPDYHFELTRPGLALYGGVPRAELAKDIQQVAFVSAAILQTRKIKTGESVGYNATYTALRDMKIGVVSLGYADGILRDWGRGNAAFEHDGKALPMLGKVSMDMIVIDLSNAPSLAEGDWVELPYHLPNAAQQSGLSQYELLTILGRRFG